MHDMCTSAQAASGQVYPWVQKAFVLIVEGMYNWRAPRAPPIMTPSGVYISLFASSFFLFIDVN